MIDVTQLCEVDLLCSLNATRTFRLRHHERTSRPISTCDEHIEGARALAISEGVEFIDGGPIGGQEAADPGNLVLRAADAFNGSCPHGELEPARCPVCRREMIQ